MSYNAKQAILSLFFFLKAMFSLRYFLKFQQKLAFKIKKLKNVALLSQQEDVLYTF